MLPIRILHTSDIHIGMENYGRIDPETGIHGRVLDYLRRLSDLVDFAIEQEVDLFVFAGDAYRTREPSPTYQREFSRRIKKLADAGVPVLLLTGNHDIPNVQRRASSISIFDTLQVPNVIVGDHVDLQTITCRRGQQLQIGMLPYPLRASYLSRIEHQGMSIEALDLAVAEELRVEAEGLAALAQRQPEIPAILVAHISLKEAAQGTEQNIMLGRDVSLPRSVVANPAWRYVALGHVHRHQSLNGSAQPPVIYSGSIERIDFGEEREPKGFVVAEIAADATTWRFVEAYKTPARPFRTITADIREAKEPISALVAAIENCPDLEQTVVRLSVKLCEEQEPLLSDRALLDALGRAYFSATTIKEVDRPDRQRLGAVSTENLSPLELLERFFVLKEVSADRQGPMLATAKSVIDAVDQTRRAI